VTRDQSRQLRALIWSWMPQDDDGLSEEPTTDEQRERALALLDLVHAANDALDAWTDRLVRVAHLHGAGNPEIGAALGVGREAIRRRLLKEPGTITAPMGVEDMRDSAGMSRNI
jgi:hypothetical protein